MCEDVKRIPREGEEEKILENLEGPLPQSELQQEFF